MFSEDLLPEWIRDRVEDQPSDLGQELNRVEEKFNTTDRPSEKMMEEALAPPEYPKDDLKALGEKFREACQAPLVEDPPQEEASTSGSVVHEKVTVQKVKFPRLQL